MCRVTLHRRNSHTRNHGVGAHVSTSRILQVEGAPESLARKHWLRLFQYHGQGQLHKVPRLPTEGVWQLLRGYVHRAPGDARQYVAQGQIRFASETVVNAPLCDIPSVVVPLRGPGQSPVLPFACCVGSLLSVGRCGRCSCRCRFRVRGAQSLAYWGCAGCGGMCRLRVSGAQ